MKIFGFCSLALLFCLPGCGGSSEPAAPTQMGKKPDFGTTVPVGASPKGKGTGGGSGADTSVTPQN